MCRWKCVFYSSSLLALAVNISVPVSANAYLVKVRMFFFLRVDCVVHSVPGYQIKRNKWKYGKLWMKKSVVCYHYQYQYHNRNRLVQEWIDTAPWNPVTWDYNFAAFAPIVKDYKNGKKICSNFPIELNAVVRNDRRRQFARVFHNEFHNMHFALQLPMQLSCCFESRP